MDLRSILNNDGGQPKPVPRLSASSTTSPLQPRQPSLPNTASYSPASSYHHTSSSYDYGSRDRSLSVSPKTRIPTFLPHQSLPENHALLQSPISYEPQPNRLQSAPSLFQPPPPRSVSTIDNSPRPMSRKRSYESGDGSIKHETPARQEVVKNETQVNQDYVKQDFVSQETPAKQEPPTRQASLTRSPVSTREPADRHSRKRSLASSVSNSEPPRKRRKRQDPLPIWAIRVKSADYPAALETSLERSAMRGATPLKGNVNGNSVAPQPDPSQSQPPNNLPQNYPPPPNASNMPPPSHPPFQNGPPPHQPRFEPSLDNIEPYSEMTRTIGDFLFAYVVNAPPEIGVQPGGPQCQIEVEAKVGVLKHPDTQERIALPVATETVIHKSFKPRFESIMSVEQHRKLNTYLNDATGKSMAPHRSKIGYRHPFEIDSFFELSPEGTNVLPDLARQHFTHKPKVRITNATTKTGEKGGRITAKIIKARIADLDVYCPNAVFDYRISVNLEMSFPADGDISDLLLKDANGESKPSTGGRMKDRMSYTHQFCQIDLTQVTVQEGPPGQPKVHELEVEVNTDELKRQGILTAQGLPSSYEDVVGGFLNNVRVLLRAASSDWQSRY